MARHLLGVPDAGNSASFLSIFLRLSLLPVGRFCRPRPSQYPSPLRRDGVLYPLSGACGRMLS
jgi:hypothetical protein